MPSTPKSFKFRCCKANPSAAERGRRGTRARNRCRPAAPPSSLSGPGACGAWPLRRRTSGRVVATPRRPRALSGWRRRGRRQLAPDGDNREVTPTPTPGGRLSPDCPESGVLASPPELRGGGGGGSCESRGSPAEAQ
ncbi:hypothetical protein mRhiFer1_008860 [Rhinolophus ferrumequinum]|uniref:Uncharacterized protein n=1 Tax=Rhinolophus ferrumequinum TaxID=59479 RepID=A0A7J8AEV6_RHIFE|nr:hypothetical protein mRhiFer1_008860 [Rhinolophus ferrumequinum]